MKQGVLIKGLLRRNNLLSRENLLLIGLAFLLAAAIVWREPLWDFLLTKTETEIEPVSEGELMELFVPKTAGEQGVAEEEAKEQTEEVEEEGFSSLTEETLAEEAVVVAAPKASLYDIEAQIEEISLRIKDISQQVAEMGEGGKEVAGAAVIQEPSEKAEDIGEELLLTEIEEKIREISQVITEISEEMTGVDTGS